MTPSSMTNPIANPGQFTAEADVRDMLHDPRIVAARAQIEMLFARGYGDRIPAESRPLLAAFCEEYLNNWLFKAAASDAQHPRFVRDFMPAYRWHGNDVPGARRSEEHTSELQSQLRNSNLVFCLKKNK